MEPARRLDHHYLGSRDLDCLAAGLCLFWSLAIGKQCATCNQIRGGTREGLRCRDIRIDKVTFTYAGASEPVLRSLNLVIAEGEFVLLTGPSGCGKSTLALALAGLISSRVAGHCVEACTMVRKTSARWRSTRSRSISASFSRTRIISSSSKPLRKRLPLDQKTSLCRTRRSSSACSNRWPLRAWNTCARSKSTRFPAGKNSVSPSRLPLPCVPTSSCSMSQLPISTRLGHKRS